MHPKKLYLLWEEFLTREPRATKLFENKPLLKWSLVYDEYRRFAIMITNHAESWNKAIFHPKKLLVTSPTKVLFHKTVEYFDAC